MHHKNIDLTNSLKRVLRKNDQVALVNVTYYIRRENASNRLFKDFDVQDIIIKKERDTIRPLTYIDLFLASVVKMNATRDNI